MNATASTVQPRPRELYANLRARAEALAWHVGRTGRLGMIGLTLVAACAVFYGSTHRQVREESLQLRADIAAAKSRPVARLARPDDAQTALAALPGRDALPDLLGSIVSAAAASNVALDAGKYEISATKAGRIVRYKASFPVIGPYPQIRAFIGNVLTALPDSGIAELSFERKGVGDPAVEAQVRLVLYTKATP